LSSKRPKPSAERLRPLAFADVKPILSRLERIADSVVLVGGQAVNFWAELYASRVPAINREAPFTSKDIDFCGDVHAVRICADRLGGTFRIATIDDHTPNTGVVTFLDDDGVKRTIDFLDSPLGLRAEEVQRLAIPAEILDPTGKPSGPLFRIMHPVQVMESRVHNAMTLPNYDSPAALKQLRLSVICAREFIHDVIASSRIRVALTLNERIFTFCLKDRDGRQVHAKHGVDPFGEEVPSLAKHSDAMTTKKTPWPPGKPLPQFATRAEEERFWLTHDFDAAMDADGKAVAGEPPAPRRTRKPVDNKGR
jgi:hypothetical protein